jgi:hypothetical protein
MAEDFHDQPDDDRVESLRLGPWERWTTDWNGDPIIEWDTEAHDEWCRKWAPPCPDGNPQRLRRALGFRERSGTELELRVPLAEGEHGAGQVIVDEQAHEVYVRVLICYDQSRDVDWRRREYVDCPVPVWLDQPLGSRAVIDVDSDDELPLYTPEYLNDVPQPEHGYRRVNRRRARGSSAS